MSPHPIALRRVLYEIPGMESVAVRDEEFTGADGAPLPMRIYGGLVPASPTVVILEGVPDAKFDAHVGCRYMDMGWTVSMAQLLAASGFTAITHSNRDPLADAVALIGHLRKTAPRIGIWSTSMHGPVALAAAAHAECAVLNNPMVKDFCPDTPLFIARAGKDENPGLNEALDAFVAGALAANRPLTVVNYPVAPHSYELYLDTAQMRGILDQAMAFLRVYLTV